MNQNANLADLKKECANLIAQINHPHALKIIIEVCKNLNAQIQKNDRRLWE